MWTKNETKRKRTNYSVGKFNYAKSLFILNLGNQCNLGAFFGALACLANSIFTKREYQKGTRMLSFLSRNRFSHFFCTGGRRSAEWLMSLICLAMAAYLRFFSWTSI